jgi:hypothetical protein
MVNLLEHPSTPWICVDGLFASREWDGRGEQFSVLLDSILPGGFAVNSCTGLSRHLVEALDLIRVKPAHPLDSRPRAGLASQHPVGPETVDSHFHAPRRQAAMLLSTGLIVVLLSILLTGLIGERGLRGVPT